MVYESATVFPTPEGAQLTSPPPISTYGFQKLATEYFAKGAWEQYQLPYTIVRPFNCVGIGERRALRDTDIMSGNVKLALIHVVPDLVLKVLKGQDPLHILGDGNQVRHYTYGGDLAHGIRLAMESPAAVNDDFNLSTAASTTRARAGRGDLAQGPRRRPPVPLRHRPAVRARRPAARPRRPQGARGPRLRGDDHARRRCSTRSSPGSGPKSRRAGCDVHHRTAAARGIVELRAGGRSSAIVPVYRSAPILPELYRRLTDALGALADRYEIILVEDCGGDDSWSVIEELAKRDGRVRGIRMSRNYGQHNALLCGIRAARYDDRSSPSTTTCRTRRRRSPKLLATLGEDFDVVYGTPRARAARLLARPGVPDHEARAAERDGRRDRAQGQRVPRVPHRGSATAFAAYRGPYVSIDVLLTWGTTRFAHVRSRHEPRADRRVELHVPHAGHARAQHDDRLQHAAAAAREPRRLRSSRCSGSACSCSCWCTYFADGGSSVPGFRSWPR